MFMGGGGKAAKGGAQMAGVAGQGAGVARPFARSVADTTPFAGVASKRNPFANV